MFDLNQKNIYKYLNSPSENVKPSLIQKKFKYF